MDIKKLRASSAKRLVNGVSVPRQDTTSFGVRDAMKKGGSAYAGESGEVDGEASRPRLDRPGRKHGGSVKKADGGSVSGGKRITSMDEYAKDHPDTLSEAARSLGRVVAGKPWASSTQSEPATAEGGKRLENWRTRRDMQERKSGGKVEGKKGGKC